MTENNSEFNQESKVFVSSTAGEVEKKTPSEQDSKAESSVDVS